MFTSYEAYMEEQRGYDYDSERIAVLRQEHHDPYDEMVHCEFHDTYFDRSEDCPEFHEPLPEPETPFVSYDPADEPPF